MASFSLKPKDVIALVCTGTPCSSESDPKQAAIYLMERYGFETRYHIDTYQSLPARARADIFMRYLLDERISAIWSLRGGEGTADIIPYLELQAATLRRLPPKLLIGFSDFTSLLIYFEQRYSWPVIHGVGARQMPLRMIDELSETTTLRWLCHKNHSIEITPLHPLNSLAHTPTKINARVTGGNLSLLHISLNDVWQVEGCGKILLIEEVNEKPHKVTRTLKHLHRIGFFNGVKAIIFAGFDFPDLSLLENDEIRCTMLRLFQQFGREVTCPVFYTDLIGHGKVNYPVPFYADAELCMGERASLCVRRVPICR
ncbi:MAG: hypothetical protein A3F10_00210 [Coxiella sp. RIFCSPHIGHO2_12_FULL_42_15]|nr:MAG: hypothetical protein A3F10_00210 [Coxiella sp. RIFCSPHIGHO2_12_FULL_42_15]